MKRIAVALLAGATAILLTSCSPSSGPASFRGLPETQCAPTAPGSASLVGIVFKTPETEPMKLQKLSVQQPEGLKVVATYVLPIQGGTVLGISDLHPDLPAWHHRRPAVGTVLTAKQTVNAVLELQRTSTATGRAHAVVLDYTVGDSTYQQAGNSQVELKTTCP